MRLVVSKLYVLSLLDEVLAHFEELLVDFFEALIDRLGQRVQLVLDPLDSFGRYVLGHRDASKTTIVGKRGTPRAARIQMSQISFRRA